MKTCIECRAEEIRTYDARGRLARTSIDPISGLCIDCLPKRTAAAPVGALFDRNAFDAKAAASRSDE